MAANFWTSSHCKQLLEQEEVDVVPSPDKEKGLTLEEFKHIKIHMTNWYFFNPRIQYKDNVHNDGEVMRGTMNVITRLARTMNERLDAMAEVERYKMKVGIYRGYDMTYAAQRPTPDIWRLAQHIKVRQRLEPGAVDIVF